MDLTAVTSSKAFHQFSVSSTCFKLNSLQLLVLLKNYRPMPDETPMAPELIEAIVRVAENSVDVAIVAEGREVRLQEDFFLPLPFLIPDDGYSCEVVRGVPSGLAEFLAPLQRKGLCVFNQQPTSGGSWTVFMDDFAPLVVLPYPADVPRSPIAEQQSQSPGQILTGRSEPEIQTIRLTKTNQGLGLSIVAARGQGRDRLGIYIKAVVKGGAAWHDGRLQAGDQILKVDDRGLVGITQERAAEIMLQTGQVVELVVAKRAAVFHGLEALLSQPSPVRSRASSATLPPSLTPRHLDQFGSQSSTMPRSTPHNIQLNNHELSPTGSGGQAGHQLPRRPSPVVPAPGRGGSASNHSQMITNADFTRTQPQENSNIVRPAGLSPEHKASLAGLSPSQVPLERINANLRSPSSSGSSLTPRLVGSLTSPQRESPVSRDGAFKYSPPRAVGTPLSSGSMSSGSHQSLVLPPSHQRPPPGRGSAQTLPSNHGARVRFQDTVQPLPLQKVQFLLPPYFSLSHSTLALSINVRASLVSEA